jgi:hypothetical protein
MEKGTEGGALNGGIIENDESLKSEVENIENDGFSNSDVKEIAKKWVESIGSNEKIKTEDGVRTGDSVKIEKDSKELIDGALKAIKERGGNDDDNITFLLEIVKDVP